MISMYLLNQIRDLDKELKNNVFTPSIYVRLYKFANSMRKHREYNCYNQIMKILNSTIDKVDRNTLIEVVSSMLLNLEINRTLEYKEWKQYW